MTERGVMKLPFRSSKINLFKEGQKHVFELLEKKIDPNSLYLWIHVSSLGEFEQGRTLIEYIKRERKEYKVILTFFSPSGYELRKNYPYADVVSYLPMDTKKNVLHFISLVKPAKAIFVKYEFWPNYLMELKKRGIPTFLISAVFKENQAFFRWYGKGYRKLLDCFTHIFVQDKESKELLDWINFSRVSICGDTRIDSVIQTKKNAKEIPLIELFAQNAKKHNRKVIIMGSSWEMEEECMEKYAKYRQKDIQLIIAPHDISETHIQKIMERFSFLPTLRLSKANEKGMEDMRVLIVDCIGLLSSLYRYGEIAIIGGGFRGNIHNILEPAVYGLPILFGPDHKNFPEAVELLQMGGAFCFREEKGMKQILDTLFENPSLLAQSGNYSSAYIESHSGGTERIMNRI